MGLIGSVKPKQNYVQSKTDVINQPADDEVEEDLLNQSAEEIQFNKAGAKAVDEDIINAPQGVDDDFQ